MEDAEDVDAPACSTTIRSGRGARVRSAGAGGVLDRRAGRGGRGRSGHAQAQDESSVCGAGRGHAEESDRAPRAIRSDRGARSRNAGAGGAPGQRSGHGGRGRCGRTCVLHDDPLGPRSSGTQRRRRMSPRSARRSWRTRKIRTHRCAPRRSARAAELGYAAQAQDESSVCAPAVEDAEDVDAPACSTTIRSGRAQRRRRMSPRSARLPWRTRKIRTHQCAPGERGPRAARVVSRCRLRRGRRRALVATRTLAGSGCAPRRELGKDICSCGAGLIEHPVSVDVVRDDERDRRRAGHAQARSRSCAQRGGSRATSQRVERSLSLLRTSAIGSSRAQVPLSES